MDFIVSSPILFSGLTIVFGVLAIVLQVRNMNSLQDKFFKGKSYPSNGGVFVSFIPVAICVLLSGISGILFLVGVVKYFLKG